MAATLKGADPRTADVLAVLRDAIGKGDDDLELEGYAAVAATLKDADPRAAAEVAALRDAIGEADRSSQLGNLAYAYAAVAKYAPSGAASAGDIALLLQRMPALRTDAQCEAFAAAIREAIRLTQPPLSWDKVGLVYAAALLQPVSAGRPSRKLVADYEAIIQQRADVPKPTKSWSGDVWAFATWARDNLPGFHPHQPKVGFLLQ
jgi:hypothetical protein